MSAIPERWKLVPVEPTLDMCLAGASARIAIETPTPAEAAYKAMLAAAPQPPDHIVDANKMADLHELRKWLNEQPNRELDRQALARVLAAFGDAEPLGRLCVFKDDEAAFGFSYDIAGNQQQHMRLQALDGAQLYAATQPSNVPEANCGSNEVTHLGEIVKARIAQLQQRRDAALSSPTGREWTEEDEGALNALKSLPILDSEPLIQAAKQALEVLESLQGGCTDSDDGTVESITVHCPEVIDALRLALGGEA